MSIIITNISDPPTSRGVNKYVLKINSSIIGYFEHKREEGLGICLRKAADAADEYYRQQDKDGKYSDIIKAYLGYYVPEFEHKDDD